MNIKIDRDLHLYLSSMTLGEYEFGAGMRGNKTPESDTDIIRFIPEFFVLSRSPVNNSHFMQYNDDGVDYVYCTVSQFIHALVNGDATICHEIFRDAVLKHKSLFGLEILFEPTGFDTFKVARGYLGLARRDLKDTKRLKGRERQKKFEHAERGINEVRRMLGVHDIQFNPWIATLEDQHTVRNTMLFEVEQLREKIRTQLPHTISDIHFNALIDILRWSPPVHGDHKMMVLLMGYYYKAHTGGPI